MLKLTSALIVSLSLFVVPVSFHLNQFNTTLYVQAQGSGSNSGNNGGSGSNTGNNGGSGSNEEVRSTKVVNPLVFPDIESLLTLILRTIVQIAVPFLVLAFMYVGFKFVAARGNSQQLAEARQAFFWTVVGTLLVLGAQLISQVLSGTIAEITRPS